MVCYGIFWSGQLRVKEGPNAHDKIAFFAFHSFLVEVQTKCWLHTCEYQQTKNPMPNFRALKFSKNIKWYNTKNKLKIESLCLELGYAATTRNLQIVLNTQTNPYLNQATPKKYLPNFPSRKYPEIDHPRHLKSGNTSFFERLSCILHELAKGY